jgi:hypothetical protein
MIMPKRTDDNQAEIVGALRRAGASVSILTQGRGVPDLLCGYEDMNLLFEIKNVDGRNRLTPVQESFIHTWRGQIAIVHDLHEALSILENAKVRAELIRKAEES